MASKHLSPLPCPCLFGHTRGLRGCWRFKLRSPCLCGKHFARGAVSRARTDSVLSTEIRVALAGRRSPALCGYIIIFILICSPGGVLPNYGHGYPQLSLLRDSPLVKDSERLSLQPLLSQVFDLQNKRKLYLTPSKGLSITSTPASSTDRKSKYPLCLISVRCKDAIAPL